MRWLCSNYHHGGGDYDEHCNDNRTNYNTASNDRHGWGNDNIRTDDNFDNYDSKFV